jgi:hypothetical protein
MRTLNFTVILVLVACSVQCASRESGVQTSESISHSIKAICEDPNGFAGQVVRLTGIFRGFRVEECRFPVSAGRTSVSRSDWLIQTGKDCLFVSGDVPPGIDLMDPSFLNRRITLKAKVIRKASGKLFLSYIDGSLLSESEH